jgi:hypothetical protein
VETKFKSPRIRIKIGNCVIEALIDSGAGRSIVSNKFFERLDTGLKFSKHVNVNLFDINDQRLACAGTITVQMLVEDEKPHEFLTQEFIVTLGIVEDCVLGLDALYEHRFMIDGHERRVYRIRESDHLPNRRDPFVLVASRIKLPPFSACVMESGGNGAKLPPDTSLYLERNPHLPTGIRVDPFLTTDPNMGIFRIVVVNETNNSITLPSTTSLGRITFQKNQQINQVSEAKTELRI